MKHLDGKTIIITGGGTTVCRSQAVRLAAEGANIVVADVAVAPRDTTEAVAAADADLAETVRQVEAQGGRIITLAAVPQSAAGMQRVIDTALHEFGSVDVVLASSTRGVGEAVCQSNSASWQTMLELSVMASAGPAAPGSPV